MSRDGIEAVGPQDPGQPDERMDQDGGADIRAAVVLHLLAHMRDADDVARYLRTLNGWSDRETSPHYVRACLTRAAEAVGEWSLRLPARARYCHERELDDDGYRSVAMWAPQLLSEAATGAPHAAVSDTHSEIEDPLLRGAFAYGAAVLADRGADPIGSDADPYRRMSSLDLRIVEDFCVYHTTIGLSVRVPTPQYLEERWSSFVASVEHGYEGDIHGLQDALSSRDLLEDIVSSVSPDGQELLRPGIDGWDRRYLACTVESGFEPEALASSWRPRRWWWYRVPPQLAPRGED